jgi:integrase
LWLSWRQHHLAGQVRPGAGSALPVLFGRVLDLHVFARGRNVVLLAGMATPETLTTAMNARIVGRTITPPRSSVSIPDCRRGNEAAVRAVAERAPRHQGGVEACALQTCADLLGHTDDTMVKLVYRRCAPVQLQAAMEMMPAMALPVVKLNANDRATTTPTATIPKPKAAEGSRKNSYRQFPL